MKVTFTLEELEELLEQAKIDSQIAGRGEEDSFNTGCRTAVYNISAKLNGAYAAKLVAGLLAEQEAV